DYYCRSYTTSRIFVF
nr:immunoglobulin light chain junction region [Macaca mulatta]